MHHQSRDGAIEKPQSVGRPRLHVDMLNGQHAPHGAHGVHGAHGAHGVHADLPHTRADTPTRVTHHHDDDMSDDDSNADTGAT